jgi:malate dehydrogenase
MAFSNFLVPRYQPRVSVIGGGKAGSTIAQCLTKKNLADVVLLDIVDGLAQALALDLMQAQGIERHNCQIIGTSDYVYTASSELVVITAGSPRKPDMSRDDLLLY